MRFKRPFGNLLRKRKLVVLKDFRREVIIFADVWEECWGGVV